MGRNFWGEDNSFGFSRGPPRWGQVGRPPSEEGAVPASGRKPPALRQQSLAGVFLKGVSLLKMCFFSKGFAFSPVLGSVVLDTRLEPGLGHTGHSTWSAAVSLVGLPELRGLLLRHRSCSLSASPLGCGRGFGWTCRSSGSFGVARVSWTRHPSILWAHLLWRPGTASPMWRELLPWSPFVLPFQAQASGLRLGSDLVNRSGTSLFASPAPRGTAWCTASAHPGGLSSVPTTRPLRS